MFVIGLTGGIGSGKTLTATAFSKLGVDIIDADAVSRDVVMPGQPALKDIAEHFGDEVITKDGDLDREKMREFIFANNEELAWLDKLLHPIIRAEMHRRVSEVSSPYCVMVIPLLVETAPNEIIDRVLVIDAPESLQILRAIERDKMDFETAETIVDAQATREERLAVADDVIENDKDVDHLLAEVAKLHEKYSALSKHSN